MGNKQDQGFSSNGGKSYLLEGYLKGTKLTLPPFKTGYVYNAGPLLPWEAERSMILARSRLMISEEEFQAFMEEIKKSRVIAHPNVCQIIGWESNSNQFNSSKLR